MRYKQYTEEWFEKHKGTDEEYEIYFEYSRRKNSFKEELEVISRYIQVINKYLLNNDYDRVREYAGYVECIVERERKTMEDIPELKTFEVEKFLEESLNEAKEALRRCPKRNSNSNTTWSDRYYKEESYEEKKARWDYEESQRNRLRMQRHVEWMQQQPWFNNYHMEWVERQPWYN